MSQTRRPRQDPWPDMETQITQAFNDLVVHHQRFTLMASPTVVAEKEFQEVTQNVQELLEDCQLAHQTVLEHPEMFNISGEEFQRRGTLVRQWERDLMKPVEELKRAIKKREDLAKLSAQAAAGGVKLNDIQAAQERKNNDNGDYLKQEYEAQQGMMADQDKAVERIGAGVTRIKNNAVLINEELIKHDKMLSDVDKDMSHVQMKLEGALKKVGKLLDESSDTKKFICIFVLLIVLALLVFLLFGN